MPVFKSPALLIACMAVLLSCGRGRSGEGAASPADTAAIAATLRRIAAIDSLAEDPSEKSRKLLALYPAASLSVRSHVLRSMLTVSEKLLYNGGPADSALLAFYYSLFRDRDVAEQNRLLAALQLANYHGYITHIPDSTAHYLELSDRYAASLNDTFRAKKAGVMAQLRLLQGRQNEAINCLYQAIRYAEKNNDSAKIASSYLNLANIYRGMSDLEQSHILVGKSIRHINSHTLDVNRLMAYGAMAADLTELGRFDSARVWYAATEALLDKGMQMPVVAHQLASMQGQMYLALRQYDSAVLYFDKARQYLPQLSDEGDRRTFLFSSTPAYAHVRNVSAEVAALKSYVPEFRTAGDVQKLQYALNALSQIAATRGRYAEALDYRLQRDSVHNGITAQENKRFLAEMDAKYQSEKKALQIQLQQKEIRRQTQLVTILALSLVAAALLASAIIIRMKLARSRRDTLLQQQFTQRLLLQTEDERSRIAAELHDSISHELLALKTGLYQGSAEPGPRIDSIINDIRRISRNLHPVMLDKIGLEASIRHLCDQLTEGGAIFVTTEVHCPRRLSPDMELQVFRIVQESLSNAAKYAGAMAAKVSLAVYGDTVSLTVLDNGKGFNVSEKLAAKDSFGLHTLLERGRAIGGKTTIASAGQGTAVHLQAPASYARAAYDGPAESPQ